MRQRRNRFRNRHRFLQSLTSLAALACALGCAQQPAESPESGATPSATSSGDPAAAGIVDRRGKGGASVFVAHRVTDFEAFKKFFEDGTGEREKIGVKGHLLTRIEERRVAVHLFADDLDVLKLTRDSPFLKEYADRTGGPDASRFWLTYDELVKLPASLPSMQTVSLYMKFFMIDLPALRSGFVKQQPLFAEHAVIASSLHVGVDQADLAFLHFVGTSRDKLDELSKHSQLLEWLTAIGSKEAPQSFLGADVSRSRTYYDDFK